MTTDFNEFSIPEEEDLSPPVENIEDQIPIEENIPPKIDKVRPEPEPKQKSKSVYVSNETHHLYKAPLSQQLLRLFIKRTGSKFNHFDFNSNVKAEFQKKLTKRVQQVVPSCTVVFDKNPDMIVQDEDGDRLCGVQWIYFNREDQCDPKKWYIDLVFMKYSNDEYYNELVHSIKTFFEQLEKSNTKNVYRNMNMSRNMNNNNHSTVNNRNMNMNMSLNNTVNNRNNNRNTLRGGKRKKTQKKKRHSKRRF